MNFATSLHGLLGKLASCASMIQRQSDGEQSSREMYTRNLSRVLLRFIIILSLSEDICATVSSCNNWFSFEERGTFFEPTSHKPYLYSGFGLTLSLCLIRCATDPRCRVAFYSDTNNACVTSPWDKVAPTSGYSEGAGASYKLYRVPGGLASCQEIKDSYPDSVNGEYWIYPSVSQFLGNPAKVYCVMENPAREYVTLSTPNVGNVPKLTNIGCNGEAQFLPAKFENAFGDNTYNKIRFDSATMVVNRTDTTFATAVGATYPYGKAGDIYTSVLDGGGACGPIGTFLIDTRGTGMKFSDTLQWKVGGWSFGMTITRENNGAVIRLLCGGWPGFCDPIGPMQLQINPHEEIDPRSATWLF